MPRITNVGTAAAINVHKQLINIAAWRHFRHMTTQKSVQLQGGRLCPLIPDQWLCPRLSWKHSPQTPVIRSCLALAICSPHKIRPLSATSAPQSDCSSTRTRKNCIGLVQRVRSVSSRQNVNISQEFLTMRCDVHVLYHIRFQFVVNLMLRNRQYALHAYCVTLSMFVSFL